MISPHPPDDVPDIQVLSETLDEVRIMQAARSDITRFAPLYDRYAPRIYAYCLRRVRNRAEAEDLTSLVFTQVLNALPNYRGGAVVTWLFRIAHNTVMSHFRAARPQVSIEDIENVLEADDLDLVDGIARQETHQAVGAFLATLPDDQRELIALKITAGLTSEQVGEIMGRSAGAVRVEFHRIIKRLRVFLDQRGGV
jgi:RNA polymerase sigma-70 factor (ECF subfamily)